MKGGKQDDMPNELNVRIKNKIDSTSGWAANDIVLMQGEMGIERTESEGDKIKIGDGVSTFSQLPYFGGSADLSSFVTADDPSSAIEGTIPETFDGHTVDEFLLKTDVVNNLTSEATNVPLSAAQGKALNDSLTTIQSQVGGISSLESEVESLSTEVDSKLGLIGGTMTGALVAQSNSNYTTRQVRNVILSTSEPTSSDGQDGDIWFVYEA